MNEYDANLSTDYNIENSLNDLRLKEINVLMTAS